MSDKINSLNLCVCMALADHGLGKDETAEILRIAKEIKKMIQSKSLRKAA